ncbi:MAG: hypothetical protein QM504_08140 [Pseudomonadota bacterium]
MTLIAWRWLIDIDKLLSKYAKNTSDKDVLGFILSNRISYYDEQHGGAMISIKNFDVLIGGILAWNELKNKR